MNPPVLELEDVNCAWAREWWTNPAEVHEGISFVLVPGEWCAIVGDNGIGKSTLLHGIVGNCPYVRGTIRANSMPLGSYRLDQRFKAGVHLVSQEPKCRAEWTYRDIEFAALKARGGLAHKGALASLKSEFKNAGILDKAELTLFDSRAARVIIGVIAAPSVLLLDEVGKVFKDAHTGARLPAEKVYPLLKSLLPESAVLFVEHDHSVVKKFATSVVDGSIDSLGIEGENKIDYFRFQKKAVDAWLGDTGHRAVNAAEHAPPLPYLDVEREVFEHLQLAASASPLAESAVAFVIKESLERWPFTGKGMVVEHLSGGQKVILHYVMELMYTGKANTKHERSSHVSHVNLKHVEELQAKLQQHFPNAGHGQ